MLTRSILAAVMLVACRDASDPGFDIVKVPMSAYAAADASVKVVEGGVAARDGGDPVVLCVPKPEKKDDDEETNDSDCPNTYQGRNFDEKATARHRAKDDESDVCCYRKGRVSHSTPPEGE